MTSPIGPDAVRPAVPADAPAIAALLVAHWRTEASPGVAARAWALDADSVAEGWRDALATPTPARQRTLAACAGPELVGLLAAAPREDEPGDDELLEVVVAPAHRRAGHGSRLLAAWADLAAADGASGGVIWVAGANDDARAFLTGAGWAADGATRTLDLDGDGLTVVRQIRLATSLEAPAP